MAWTSPKTFTAASVLTAAELNTHLRDNLLETCPATVTTAGDLVYADAANSMGNRLAVGGAGSILVSTGSAPTWRQLQNQDGNSSALTFTNTSYLALDAVTGGTPGSAISITLTTGTKALLWYRCFMSNTTVGALSYLSYSVSGATTTAANDIWAFTYRSDTSGYAIGAGVHNIAALTAGSNTFELEARCSAGTTTMQRTELTVLGL